MTGRDVETRRPPAHPQANAVLPPEGTGPRPGNRRTRTGGVALACLVWVAATSLAQPPATSPALPGATAPAPARDTLSADSQTATSADSAAEARPLVRRLFVPADAASRWPRGDWEPFPAERLDQLLRAAQRRQTSPTPPPIRSAVYSARVEGMRLVAGVATWDLSDHPVPLATPSSARLRDLGHCQLPLYDLQVRGPAGQEAVAALPWGRAEDGRLWLMAPAPRTTVTARFGLDGRHVGGFWHWSLRVPPALRSRIELQVPAGLRLASSAGLVSGPVALTAPDPVPAPAAANPSPAGQAPATSPPVLWHIDLGAQSECELQLFPELPDRRPGVLLARPELSLVVRPEATRFRAVFDLSAGEHPVTEVDFELPPSAEIASVRWGDDWLEWERPADRRDRLRVRFADPLTGETRRVELQGLLPADDRSEWTLPAINVVGALELEGPLLVRTIPPFRLARWRGEGLREVSFQASPEGSETLEFVRVSPEATLTFEPEVSTERLTVRQIDLLGSSADDDLVACLEWSVSDGQIWSAELDLSPGWEVADVRALSAGRGDRGLDWQVNPGGDAGRLICQFAEALTPGRPLTAQVSLRASQTPETGGPRLPAVVPTGDVVADYTLLAVGAAPPAIGSSAATFQPLPLGELPDWIEPLGLASRTEPAVWRLPGVSSRSPVQLVPPQHSTPGEPAGPVSAGPVSAGPVSGGPVSGGPVSGGRVPGSEYPSDLTSPPDAPPRAVGRVDIVVDLAGVSTGYDRYVLEFELPPGWPAGPLTWQFDPQVSDIVCFLNNQPAIPPAEVPGYDSGILVPPIGPGQTTRPRRLRLEYRTPVDEASFTRRRLLFPRLQVPVLESLATLRVAPGQVLLTPPPGFAQRQPVAGDAPQPLRPLLGRWLDPQARMVSTPWWSPWTGRGWRDLLRQLEGPVDPDDPLDLAEQWHSRQLGLPDQLPLEVARRDTTLISGLLLLGLGIALTLLARRCFHQAHPLWVGGALLLLAGSLPWWSGGRLQGLIAIATGLLLGLCWPERWRLGRRGPGDTSRLQPRSSAPLAIPLGVLAGGVLLCLALSGSFAWSQAPAVPPAPPGVLGDVLVPLASSAEPAPNAPVVYLSPTLRQQLERLATPPQPTVLVESLELETPLDGQGRQLVVARLECWLTGTGPTRLALPLAGVRLADTHPCLVDGQPADLLSIANSQALLLELGDTPPPLSAPVPDSTPATVDRPAAPPLPEAIPATPPEGRDSPAASHLCRRVEIVLRMFPIPAVPGEPGPGLRLPPAGITRLAPVDPTADGELIPAGEFPTLATLPEARLAGELPGGWRWRTRADANGSPPSPLRLTAQVRVDLQGQAARVSVVFRCRPGSRPCEALAWLLPPGLMLREARSDAAVQTALFPQEGGARRLEVQFVPPVREPVSVELELIQAAPAGEFELLLPEPVESWPETGLPGLLSECRLGVFPPPDRQLTVRPAIADLPLRAWISPPSDWGEGWREAGQQFAYELDMPRRVLLQLDPRPPAIEAQLEQRGEIFADRIDWRWRAEQVGTPRPVWHHELRVDPRLKLTLVDVLHEQSSQLRRWSRRGDRLTLFLSGPSEPGQIIEVRGTLPLAEGISGGLPTVTLAQATVGIERRVLLAEPGVPVRLTAANWVETQTGGQRVLLDAPVAPTADWPGLESLSREEPDRPAAPSEPEVATPAGGEGPTAGGGPRLLEVELAELVMQESAGPHREGRLTVWLPPGAGSPWELHWPAGAELRGLAWQGRDLVTREAPGVLTVQLPDRAVAGRLVLHWRVPGTGAAEPAGPRWSVSRSVAVVWPRQTRVARVLLGTATASAAAWRLGGTLRGLPGDQAARLVRETDQRLAIASLPAGSPGDQWAEASGHWLLGNSRLTQELQRTGAWTGGLDVGDSPWPLRWTALLLAGLGIVVGLTRPWWPAVQSQSLAALCGLGCLTWVGLSGTPWGALLALATLPFLVLSRVSPPR